MRSIFDPIAKRFFQNQITGDAGAGDLLATKTATVQGGTEITGTMPNKGAVNITPGTAEQAIPQGYHSGAGKVAGDNDLVPGNIKSGVNIFGVVGDYGGDTPEGDATAADILLGKTATVSSGPITGTMPNNGAFNITPGAADKNIPAGYHSGAGKVLGDSNLVAGNIKDGVDIFGISGNLLPLNYKTGTITSIEATSSEFKACSGDSIGTLDVSYSKVSISGHGFTPKVVLLKSAGLPGAMTMWFEDELISYKTACIYLNASGNIYNSYIMRDTNITVTSLSIVLPVFQSIGTSIIYCIYS